MYECTSAVGDNNVMDHASELADCLEEQWLVARLGGIRAIKLTFVGLYGTLLDDQKKTANELLASHIGMMAMMSGMQPGQMGGPNQMTPGQMQLMPRKNVQR